MNTSLFELFKIGIGPSSSHTVGPMRAAFRFVQELQATGQLEATASLCVELYGSLALTGIGHATDRALLLGLTGKAPDTVDPGTIDTTLATIRSSGSLLLNGTHPIGFREEQHLLFRRDQRYPPPGTPTHPNGLRLAAFDQAGNLLRREIFYSVGGGFIVSGEDFHPGAQFASSSRSVPYPFRSARELLAIAEQHGVSIAELILRNELALLLAETSPPGITRPSSPQSAPAATPQAEIEASILCLFNTMRASAERGIIAEGILPGGLNVRRRAHRLAARLQGTSGADPLAPMDWVTVYAMAVNEENAAGGRVVTAPTNGAAGVLPAIALYFLHHTGLPPAPSPVSVVPRAARSFGDNWDGDGWGRPSGSRSAFPPLPQSASLTTPPQTAPAAPAQLASTHNVARQLTVAQRAGLLRFFLTAAAIGILYKENASISGAEVGCQGEVGVACSMAAGGLVAALGGTNAQIEHAAEIAMEHNLGMTCDPIGGLVQIPCIERNGMGAVKAINAARLALADTDTHKLSLDQVIETMYRTGLDMQSRYKETSLGGLALNIIEC